MTAADSPRVVVLDVVGLQPAHLEADLAPNLATLMDGPRRARLQPSFPALTVPAQTTLGTGHPPGEHGDVASGRYDREHDTVTFWGRDRGDRTRLWERASEEAGLTTGAICFQHLLGTSADVALTPSPIEDENNDMVEMDCWTNPDGWYDELREEYGHFPLHHYWGPGANSESTAWILTAAAEAVTEYDTDLLWAYVPHLDYAGLRQGPESAEMREAVRTVDALVGDFLDSLRSDGRWSDTVVAVVSEYGFHDVDTPVYPNRALRDAGLLTERAESNDVDLRRSRAFAMVDHQVAHVYVDDGSVVDARDALVGLDGVDRVLGDDGKAAYGIDHANAGELVCVAEPDAWFQYYWWREETNAPAYATDMDIHEKPGFDPCELFVGDSGLVSLDPTQVGGSHGRTDVPGFFGVGGPAAPRSLPQEVPAPAVAPTVADLLGTGPGFANRYERPSVLE